MPSVAATWSACTAKWPLSRPYMCVASGSDARSDGAIEVMSVPSVTRARVPTTGTPWCSNHELTVREKRTGR